jgi:TM2 domain-containing membrane protein YozV
LFVIRGKSGYTYWSYRGHVHIYMGVQMAGQGSGGNVLAALASFFIPGLGQLVQGRLGMAIIHFLLASVLWFVFLGWVIHLWSTLDAARFKPPGE